MTPRPGGDPGVEATWWTAVLVDRIAVAGKDSRFSLRLVLVRATDWDSARRRALDLGAAENERYENEDGEDVTWECVDVLDVHGLLDANVEEGAELYSFFVTPDLLDEIRARVEQP